MDVLAQEQLAHANTLFTLIVTYFLSLFQIWAQYLTFLIFFNFNFYLFIYFFENFLKK